MSDTFFSGSKPTSTWSRAFRTGCLAATLALLTAPFAVASEVSLKISEFRSYLSEDHPVMRGMQISAQALKEASAGRVTVEVTDPLRDSPYEIVDLLVKGDALADGPHLVVLPAIGLVPVEPAFELLNLPYLMSSYEHADKTLQGAFGAELLSRLETKGLIGLAWWENGFQHLYSVSKPLRKPEDFKSLTLRLMPDAGYAAGFEALGATVVNPPFSEVAGLLKSGGIDALDSYVSQFFQSKIFQAGGYLNATGHSYSAMVVVMTRAEWDALDAETQTLLRTELPRAAARQREANRSSERQAMAAMAEQGVHVIQSADIARDALAAALKGSLGESLAAHDEKLLLLLEEISYFDASSKAP